MRATPDTQHGTSLLTHTERKRPDFFWSLYIAACLILLALGLALLSQQVLSSSKQLNDFCQDYIAARRLMDHVQPYLPLHMWTGYHCTLPVDYDGHPPSSVLFFLPFSLLSNEVASIAWGFFCWQPI